MRSNRQRAFGLRTAAATVLAAAAALVVVGPAEAATIAVSTTADLERAVASAQSGDEIVLAATTYAPTKPLVLKGTVTLRGDGAAPGARISGAALPADAPDLLVVDDGAVATVRAISFTSTASRGAAFVVRGRLNLENAAVAGNAGNGLVVKPKGSTTIVNSTISANLAVGLVVHGSALLANATVSHNAGGGIAMNRVGDVTVKNVIVAANGKPGVATPDDCDGAIAASSASLATDSSCGVQLGNSDPRLGPLTLANGGTTPTRALGDGSPAIDAGGSDGCPATDQRGARRSTCDIGAYEAGASAPAVSPAGGSASTPGGGASEESGADQKNAAQPIVAAAGRGTIQLRGRRASFRVVGISTVSTRKGLVQYTDVGRIRLVRATITNASFGVAGRTATIRGTALDLYSRKRVSFLIVLRDRGKAGDEIRVVAGRYQARGTLTSGAITVTSVAV